MNPGKERFVRELYLLRHAKTKLAENGQADRDRALAPRGLRASVAIGTYMASHGMTPDRVLCSSARRTRETLDLVLSCFSKEPKLDIEDELYLAEPETLLQRLREVPEGAQRVLLIGHNPGMHELAHHLARNASDAVAQAVASRFPTGALARYKVGGEWQDLDRRDTRLVGYVTPKELDSEG